jgi:pyridinium-3,5-bisthiocarboxylic acid mononucleotide nickel chelatase
VSEAATLFIEPFSGLSGDMLLGALLDLGDSRFTLDDLRELARSLVGSEVAIEAEKVWRGSLSGLSLHVEFAAGDPPHRGLAEVERIIAASSLDRAAKQRAAAVFRRLAEAEARVHGTTPDQIHFHEVGAADALVDICGAALALSRLSVERVLSTPPVTGSGTVHCAHGELPVPAPGTAELLRGLPHVLGGGSGERLTPTGAALLAELCERFEPPGAFETAAIGYGAGQRDPKDGPPNVVRVQLGRPARSAARPEAWLMEFNLDDMSGEELGFLVRALREGGALEVWTAAVQMKKDRPGAVVSLLCRAERRAQLEGLAFRHSTTLGVRWTRTERSECRRETFSVDLGGERVRVVRRFRPGEAPDAPVLEADLSPEYDDLAQLAARTGLPLRDLERAAVAAALAQLAPTGPAAAR